MLRNKLRYLVLLAGTGLLTILYNEYYISIIFITMLLIPFLLFGLLSYLYGQIGAELAPVVYMANKGEKIPISVRINNQTIFPVSNVKLYITYKNAYSGQKFKKTISAIIDYKTNTSVIFYLTSQYAGNMVISLQGIRIYDYMKLFSLKKKLNSELKVAVLPSYYELEDCDFMNRSSQPIENDNFSPFKKGDDPSEVFEIREYREGDRIQRVHWKLSSKCDQLMIKEFSDPISCSLLLFVNMCIPEEESTLFYMDAMLECALTLSYSLMRKGKIHYLAWYDVIQGGCNRVCISSERDLYDAMDGLLHAQPYKNDVDSLAGYLAEYPYEQYSDLILMTGEVYAPMINSFSKFTAGIRQILYMQNTGNTRTKQDSAANLMQLSGETGIELMPVDVTNVRKDILQLSKV